MDEEVYPRVPPKPGGKKEKALASSLQMEEETMKEKEQEDVAKEEENAIDLNDNEIDAPGEVRPP